jgi:orotate phosphoribosyltransferase-like protein
MQQIEWRRDRVLELSSQGFGQSDIATVLQVDKSIISRDVAYLRHEAQEKIKTHIEKTMPEEYQKGMVSIDQVLRITWSIVSKTADERVRLQALALIDQCNSHKMDMVTNGAIITDALKYVNGKADKLKNSVSTAALEEEEEEDYQTNVSAETEETTN